MGEKENQQAVVEMLLEHGWRPDGHTFERTIALAVGTTRHEGKWVTLGGKPRFVSPDGKTKVSVGVRTTYFYEPQKDKAYDEWPGKHFKTKEIDKIRDYIENAT